jgi:hyperosmotically inducible protein
MSDMNLNQKMLRLTAVYLVLAMVLMAAASCRTPAGRTSGEVVDDATITSKVKAKLLDENVLRGVSVSVQTFEGEVTLTGAVDTKEQKDRAEDVAKNVYGVRKVNNLIKVKNE